MFEPDMESEIWRMIENYDVTAWILYSSCGVHLVKLEGLHILLLVDKVWKSVQYGVSKELDTAYWAFFWSTDMPYLLDGYGVLVLKSILFKISSIKLHSACDLSVATPRALVYAVVMSSWDARSWFSLHHHALHLYMTLPHASSDCQPSNLVCVRFSLDDVFQVLGAFNTLMSSRIVTSFSFTSSSSRCSSIISITGISQLNKVHQDSVNQHHLNEESVSTANTNEVKNRMANFGNQCESTLKKEIVEGLIELLDSHNALVQLFRTARNKYMEAKIPDFKVILYNVIGTRQYKLPTAETIGAIVFAETSDGYHTDMKLVNVSSQTTKANKRLSMNMYYSYQIHDRLNDYSLILRGGRLCQQYVVTAYCAIEQSRLDFIRQKQNDIRNEYLSGIYDAILRGDCDANNLGMHTVLTASFTGGPRYMYAHYLDALAICRVHGSPSFFITFTCNAKWPEIEEYMEPFPQLTTADRADIVDRVFEKKVRDYITFVRDSNTFGNVTAVLYTIEFQKRGLPHCHSLLWIDAASKVNQPIDVNQYISAELPDPKVDANGYRIISELMIHGPCGYANRNASCMKDGSACNRNFPKPYCDKTYIDKDGYVHYRRRDTGIQTQRQSVWLDNQYVVPYNRTLCMRYYAHINVEYCGWTMLIKYLFKYISKGTDRVIANVTRPTANAQSTTSVPAIEVDEIKNYVEARYIGPHEACWRILDFPIHYRNPSVQTLAVHLENMQQITFRSKDNLESIVNNPMKKKRL
ncbi:DNA helicase [Tanacetum coccineum]